jgi:hypothetical protein
VRGLGRWRAADAGADSSAVLNPLDSLLQFLTNQIRSASASCFPREANQQMAELPEPTRAKKSEFAISFSMPLGPMFWHNARNWGGKGPDFVELQESKNWEATSGHSEKRRRDFFSHRFAQPGLLDGECHVDDPSAVEQRGNRVGQAN